MRESYGSRQRAVRGPAHALAVLRLQSDTGLDEELDGLEVALTAGIVQERKTVAITSQQELGIAVDQLAQRSVVLVEARRCLIEAAHAENDRSPSPHPV